MLCMSVFFVFNQKTAYEMRISDWSSDVCSSDLWVITDWHNFGTDYDRTLQAWRRNIEAAWERLSNVPDERFRRMWRYYLAASMGQIGRATCRERGGQYVSIPVGAVA